MKEIVERINKMSNREYLDKVKEAMAYCKERKLLPPWDKTKEGMQKAAFQAIMRMELDKSSGMANGKDSSRVEDDIQGNRQNEQRGV